MRAGTNGGDLWDQKFLELTDQKPDKERKKQRNGQTHGNSVNGMWGGDEDEEGLILLNPWRGSSPEGIVNQDASEALQSVRKE